jgi:hypothetical protein
MYTNLVSSGILVIIGSSNPRINSDVTKKVFFRFENEL